MNDTYEKLCLIVSEHFNIPDMPLKENMTIKDLGGYELDIAEIELAAEIEFGFTITDKEYIMQFNNDATLGSITKFINAKLGLSQEEIKPEPKPVTFMEAVKAYEEGLVIKCIDKYGVSRIYEDEKGDGKSDSRRLYQAGRSVSVNEIIYGIWYIEEDKA